MSVLRSIVSTYNPSATLFALDSPRDSLFRTKIYTEYKSGRTRDPFIDEAVRDVVSALVHSGAPCVRLPGYEADDIIASAASLLRGLFEIVILSEDKDLGQLACERVSLHKGGSFLTHTDVEKRWNVPPRLIPDVQALCGDKVDCIPGVPGVGPVTAAKLVRRHGSVEGVFVNRGQLSSSLAKKIGQHDWKRNLQLTRLVSTLDLPITLQRLRTVFPWSRFMQDTYHP